MFGRIVVVAAWIAACEPLPAQTPARPEALLPPDTLLYVGTSDFEALRASAHASPLGRVFAEQEMKDFLEKPLAMLGKAIDQGVAMARGHEAFAGVELDPQKMLAGPYGRTFFAMTHLVIPPNVAQDPSGLDLGMVLGIEARGGYDLLGTLKQVLFAVARSEGGDKVVIDTVDAGGVSIERIKASDAPFAICFANLGGVSVMSLSEKLLREMAGRLSGGGPSLLGSPELARGAAATGAAGPGDLSMFMHLGRMMRVARGAMDVASAAGGAEAVKPMAIANAIFDAMNFDAFGPMYAVSTWKDGTAVSTAYAEVNFTQPGLASLGKPQAIDRNLLALVPKDALSFSIGHFDLSALWDMAMGALKNASAEAHGEVMAALRNAEILVAGADEHGNPNWDLRRDLIGALSGRMMSVTAPGAGSMFGPGGDSVFWIETPNPAGLEKSLEHLFALPGKLANYPINFKEQLHGEAKLKVLDPMSLGPAAMMAGQLSLTYAIHDGRFWFATSTKALKKALDSRSAPPAENITAKADFAKRFVEPPQGALLTSLSYGDTATNFENSYTQILGVLPMMMMGLQQAGAGDELPIDLSLLPTGETISKHLFGTVTMSYAVGNGNVTVTRGPFGPEMTVGAVAAGIGIAAGVGVMSGQRRMTAAEAMHEPEGVEVTAEPMDPAAKARSHLGDLEGAITVYMIEYGKPPTSLAVLVKPTEQWPEGFLASSTLPVDPWGRDYAYSTDGEARYTIWSFGPNGVDDKGAGDDVVLRN